MNILNTVLARITETAAGDEWWNKQTPEFKKAYIKNHPNSKYAKGSDGGGIKGTSKKPASQGRSSDEKMPTFPKTIKELIARKQARQAAAKKAAKEAKQAADKNPKAASEKAHADLMKATEALNELKRKHSPEFRKYNELLDAADKATGKKLEAITKQLDELEGQAHIKKALKLSTEKRAAKQALDEAKKAALKAPAKPVAKPAAPAPAAKPVTKPAASKEFDDLTKFATDNDFSDGRRGTKQDLTALSKKMAAAKEMYQKETDKDKKQAVWKVYQQLSNSKNALKFKLTGG